MDFWPFQNLSKDKLQEVWEGVLVAGRTSLKGDLGGTLFLLVTALMFLSPGAPPGYIFTSLPVLYHLAEQYNDTWGFEGRVLPLLGCASALSSSLTSWPVLDNKLEVVGGQVIFSGFMSAVMGGIVQLHRSFDKLGGIKGKMDGAAGFGLLWASAWQLWSLFLPFGQYGIPSVQSGHIKLLDTIHRYIGQAGMDTAAGAFAYAIYRAFSRDHSGKATPRIQEWPSTPISSPNALKRSNQLRQRHGEHATRDATLLRIPRPSKKVTLATAASIIAVHALSGWASEPSLSAPLNEATPFGVGCTYSSTSMAPMGITSRPSFMPQKHRLERASLMEEITERVCAKFKVWVVLGLDTPDWVDQSGSQVAAGSQPRAPSTRRAKRRNEAVLIGPAGEIDRYAKQKLVPYVESYGVERGLMPVPVWKLPLSSPPGVNKTDWAPAFPFVREITVAPLICLDSYHPSLLHTSPVWHKPGNLPQFLVIPAAAPTGKTSRLIFEQAQRLSTQHGVPSIVCSSTRHEEAGPALSGVIDATGDVVHQQRGGGSFVGGLSIPYDPSGKGRPRTGSEMLGASGVLGGTALILASRRLFSGGAPLNDDHNDQGCSSPGTPDPRTPSPPSQGPSTAEWIRLSVLSPIDSLVSRLGRGARRSRAMPRDELEDPFVLREDDADADEARLISITSTPASNNSTFSYASVAEATSTSAERASHGNIALGRASPVGATREGRTGKMQSGKGTAAVWSPTPGARQAATEASPLISLASTSRTD